MIKIDTEFVDSCHYIDAETISRECGFRLDADNTPVDLDSERDNDDNDNVDNVNEHNQREKNTEQHLSAKKRLSTKSFAITSWSTVPSQPRYLKSCFVSRTFVCDLEEIVLNEIKRQFGIERIQYACVAKEVNIETHKTHLHIQIILKTKGNKRSGFLDKITSMFYLGYILLYILLHET